jgi:hypothetical protein
LITLRADILIAKSWRFPIFLAVFVIGNVEKDGLITVQEKNPIHRRCNFVVKGVGELMAFSNATIQEKCHVMNRR